MDNVDCCIQLNAIETSEKVADLNTIINAIIAVSFKALCDCVLLCGVQHFVLIPPYFITIIVGVKQLLFCMYLLPYHAVRAKESLKEVKVHCSTILTAQSLLWVDMCFYIYKDQESEYILRLSALNVLHWNLWYSWSSQAQVWWRFHFASTNAKKWSTTREVWAMVQMIKIER